MLEVIRGALGSGKSQYVFDKIKEKSAKDGGKNLIIVPEQFSYKTEKAAVQIFGGAGLNDLEVLTFSRLYSRCFAKGEEERLTPSGKRMLVYEALTRVSEENIFYGCKDKPGFAELVADIVTEFNEYLISPEVLRRKAEKIGVKLLAEKLTAVAEILEIYADLTKDRFFDSEEDILRLADYALKSGEFNGYDFWLDEFSVLLPQHYAIIEALLKCGCKLHISVSIDAEESEFYGINRGIIKKLKDLAARLGTEYSEHKTDDVCRSIRSEELRYLKENIDNTTAPDFVLWEEPTKDISLFVGKDLYKEVRHTALMIRRLVMEEGCRWRDIAVACADTEAYSHIIEAVFNDFGIPYFTDMKMPASDHPVALTALSVFDIVLENWSYSAVFQYLRTGYVFFKDDAGTVREISPEGVDLTENYVLKYGIRGKNIWLDDEKWLNSQRGIFDTVLEDYTKDNLGAEELLIINETRGLLIAPFKKLYDRISGRRTVREFAAALFGFFEDICLYDGLQKRAAELDDAGLRNEAEQARKIWNIIIETLDQAVTVMGEEKCGREDFAGIIKAGLSAVEISIIPSGLDRVSVSSVERSRQHEARVMFIMGAVFGAIPKEAAAEGILTDGDRLALKAVLAEDGMEIAADTQLKCEMDRFNFFSTLFKVKDKVFITYPAASAEGETNRPAAIIGEIYKIFPKLTAADDIIAEDETELLYSPKSAYGYMLANYKKGGVSAKIYGWFEKNDPEKLNIIKNAADYKLYDASITAENAARLYGEIGSYSASRINEYGKCPFGYFVKYGLKAKEREIWQIHKFDLGSLMHMAIELYCQRVDNGAESFAELRGNWRKLSNEESEKILSDIINDIKARILGGLTRDENKVSYIMARVKKIVERSAERVRKSLSAGEYAAVCYEKKFRVDIKWKEESVRVNGCIDRLDMAEDSEERTAELRVVDYKTGRKNFSVVSICNRQDMQLVMYAIAAVEMYSAGDIRYAKSDYTPKTRAILYNHMRDDFVLADTEEEGEELKLKNSRPDGLIVLDEDENGEMIPDAAFKMDRHLEEERKSDVIRVDLNQDGTPGRYSQVATSSAFDMICDYVKKAVIETDRDIYSGIIKIYPYCENGENACGMCEFEEICLYNERFDSARELIKDSDEAMEHIKKEVSE